MIPVNEPLLNGNEKKYLNQCIDSGWISSDGPFIEEFENKFSDYIGTKHGIAVCNGTAAIEVALYAIGVGKGDEVIIPSFTIISCVLGILRLGAKPVLVDIDSETWNMDISQVESKITPKTKAIMPTHIYGHPADLDPLLDICKKFNLYMVEDAAEAHGAEYKARKCGSIGHISTFSFYPNKLITTGEGGMVLCNDDKFDERARSYRNLCFIPEKRFYHEALGYNFRMTNMQAAIGLAQLERIEETVSFKRKMGEYYISKLKEIDGVQTQMEKQWAKTVYWMYAVVLSPKLGKDATYMMEEFHKHEIGTRPFFRGMHDQPVLNNLGLFKGEHYPKTDEAYKYGFYLPSGMTLTYNQIDKVVEVFQTILGK